MVFPPNGKAELIHQRQYKDFVLCFFTERIVTKGEEEHDVGGRRPSEDFDTNIETIPVNHLQPRTQTQKEEGGDEEEPKEGTDGEGKEGDDDFHKVFKPFDDFFNVYYQVKNKSLEGEHHHRVPKGRS